MFPMAYPEGVDNVTVRDLNIGEFSLSILPATTSVLHYEWKLLKKCVFESGMQLSIVHPMFSRDNDQTHLAVNTTNISRMLTCQMNQLRTNTSHNGCLLPL